MRRPSNATVRSAFGLLLTAAISMSSSATARADEAHALITIGMRRVFDRVMLAFEATSGSRFRIEYASTIEIAQRVIGGESADFVVASRAGIDKLMGANKVREDGQFDLGGSVIAVAVPKGRAAPDISTVEGVKNALLAAKTVSYTDPASGGPSGIHLAQMLERLGISEQVNAKTRFPPAGGPVGDVLARGEADIGIQQSVELTSYPGVDVVGPLPREIQVVTVYSAAIPEDSVHPDAGRSLMSFLRSPEGARLLREGGLDPR